ncbi:hypothetical protein ACJ73_00143 [Blastomyces percursus]|uniref:Aminoglycoside phosphotransferase domain-containing protein n=1 Tax=Blastomyces percursus TaxID=1658174 RepID=A0A1J9QJ12_9EURO|nr:hypothetical protein ACJ73_00143 [Blastomyces percursus]
MVWKRLYWAAFLVFDDGVEWVFRSPRRDGAIQSKKTIQTLLASEAATLKYIKSYSAIPVPVVYAYSSENDIGIPYILMSKAAGFTLRKKWKSLGSRESTLSLKEKSKIVSQLGVITWQGLLNTTFYKEPPTLKRQRSMGDEKEIEQPVKK